MEEYELGAIRVQLAPERMEFSGGTGQFPQVVLQLNVEAKRRYEPSSKSKISLTEIRRTLSL